MRRHPATSSHNYLAKLGEVALPTARSGVNVARVEHDGWCDFQHGRGFCNCDPVVVLEDAAGEYDARGHKLRTTKERG